jgi:peroxiredoxin
VLGKFSDKNKIGYPLLSDPDSKAIKDYGLLNKEAKGKQAGIPHPGTLVLDSGGVIRAKVFFDNIAKRHSVEELIKAAESVK